jgi:antitoxin component HigA of HigAB toxin-antitoxin module
MEARTRDFTRQDFTCGHPQRERKRALHGPARRTRPQAGQVDSRRAALGELLTLLIEDFEQSSKPATGIEALELMEANSLKQKHLVSILGTPSIISEVLNGKRRLTTEHIRKLSRRFHVSPELFF